MNEIKEILKKWEELYNYRPMDYIKFETEKINGFTILHVTVESHKYSFKINEIVEFDLIQRLKELLEHRWERKFIDEEYDELIDKVREVFKGVE